MGLIFRVLFSHKSLNRLEHVSEKCLVYFFKQKDKPLSSLKFCKHYVLGEHIRVKFGKDIHISKHNFEYINFDLWVLLLKNPYVTLGITFL